MTTPLTSLLSTIDADDHPGRIIARVMAAARDRLGLDVSFVSEFEGGQRIFRFTGGAVERYQVAVEGAEPLEDTYCHMVVNGSLGALVNDAQNHPVTQQMAVTEALGVQVYVGVPVQFSDGRLFGTLCCLSADAGEELSERDVGFMHVAAAIVAEQLERDDLAASQRREMTKSVRAAIEGDFQVVYQPIVALTSGDVLGYEALSRFGEGAGSPQECFDQAWQVGLGTELEVIAARKALAELERVPADAYLSINLSPETLLSPQLPDLFSGVDASRLVIEITEHAYVLDYAPIRSTLDGLRDRGIRVAIDDLGTGHAGIKHLLEFQPDILKIDLGVVRGIRRDPRRRAVAATFVTLAFHIGASVVAEGVETAEDRDALEILGLTAGQGFHLARPAPLDALVAPAID